MLTNSQKKFAASHDWFIMNTNQGVLVNEVMVSIDRQVTETQIEFTDFTKLKDWAGY